MPDLMLIGIRRRILPQEAPRFRELALEMLRQFGWPEYALRAVQLYVEGDLPEGLSPEELAQIDAAMMEIERLGAKAINGLTTTH